MNNKTKYWIIIDSWNLMESFANESISPFSFYMKRSFGNNLSRYFSKGGETFDHLILTEFPPKAKFAIEVSEELLDVTLLERQGKSGSVALLYPKTIYFKKGFIRFRFNNEDEKMAFISESKILFEVKCIEKYMEDFYVDNTAVKSLRKKPETSISFNREIHIEFDSKFNFTKGAIIGFARGQMTSLNNDQQNLQIRINDLKNSFAGLNTQLMMNEDPVRDLSSIQKIAICKKDYYKQGLEQTNLFDILSQVFQEIVNLAALRSKELEGQKTPNYKKDFDEYQSKAEECRGLMRKIETEYSINRVREELENIKQKEVLNGKAVGKSRLYFTKSTPEYQRKQELKEIIQTFENENKEYLQIKRDLYEIEDKIAKYRYGFTEYDTTLTALFIRLSDGINDILKKINSRSITNNVNLSKLNFDNNRIEITDNKFDSAELVYFNIVLNHILSNPITGVQLNFLTINT